MARTSGPVLRLRRDRHHPHPWIYRDDVASVSGDAKPGDAVTVVDAAGGLVGRGFYNPQPSLVCRIATTADEELDTAFFTRRLSGARDYRHRHQLLADAHRLVWSEGDGLPGLVIDRYGPMAVMQCLTLGIHRALPTVAAALREVVGDLPIYLLDDATAASLEGFEPRRGWLDSPGPEAVTITEGDCRFAISPGEGQKTGFYLDQAENRTALARSARGGDVLDAFSYTGAFATHALVGGARRAICLDSSAPALARAADNLRLNGVLDRVELREANAFDELRQLERAGTRFGLVILDPPPFTRRKTAIEAAARGYKEINLRGLRLLAPGGLLATFSCSHHISPPLFEDICREAAADAGVTVRVAATLGQSRDHPVLLTVPETRYLKGLLLEAV